MSSKLLLLVTAAAHRCTSGEESVRGVPVISSMEKEMEESFPEKLNVDGALIEDQEFFSVRWEVATEGRREASGRGGLAHSEA